MEPNQQPPAAPQHHSNTVYLIVGVIIIGLILVFGLMSRRQGSGLKPTQTIEVQQPTQAPKTGSMSLVKQESTTAAKVGVPFTLAVAINSMGKPVTGFDTLLNFDKTAFTVGAVTSLFPGYQVDSDTQKVALAVTGYKSSAQTAAQTMSGVPVFTVKLTPKRAGVFTINLMDMLEKSKSKFVDTSTNVYYPTVGSLTVTVQ